MRIFDNPNTHSAMMLSCLAVDLDTLDDLDYLKKVMNGDDSLNEILNAETWGSQRDPV